MFLSLGIFVFDDSHRTHCAAGGVMALLRSHEKSISGMMHRRMSCSSKIYWSKNKELSPSAWCLHHDQMAEPPGRLEDGLAAGGQGQRLGPQARTSPHQAEKDQGPEILCHWPCMGRAPNALAVQFIRCQILVQFSLCPVQPASLCSWLHSGQHCAAAPDPHSRGCSCQAHMAAQRVCEGRNPECVLLTRRGLC